MFRLAGHTSLAHFAALGYVAGVATLSPYVLDSTYARVFHLSNLAGFGTIVSVEAEWRPSPNYTERPPGTVVDTVVIHATVIDSVEATAEHFARPSSKVSAHYTIGKDGRIVQHVLEEYRAHHAGDSLMRDGREKVNDFSIGIELVNRNDGVDPYPAQQVEALNTLLTLIKLRHPIRYVVGHSEIAQPPGRKSDPLGFDFRWIDR